ncbi:MAG: hypothetical protein N3A59_00690 [Thermodesulfovibrionales bacterium]|nr:hypothetical protein [Thermodesulfovibrionales bacterium]
MRYFELTKLNYKIKILLLFLLLLILLSCIPLKSLKTEEISSHAISGAFDVILYGARYSGDLENIAILDIINDQYSFDIIAPSFDYKIRKNIPADQAIKMAESFVASYGSFKYAQISQIKLPNGLIVGYEVRPLYSASEFGFFDVLEIDYWLDNTTIKVKIDLVPEVKKRLFIDEDFQSNSQ